MPPWAFSLLLLLCVPCGRAAVSPDVYCRPQLPPADPDATQQLSALENAALTDLYSSLIQGSTAEALHHANWATTLASVGDLASRGMDDNPGSANLCNLDGAYTLLYDPLLVSVVRTEGAIPDSASMPIYLPTSMPVYSRDRGLDAALSATSGLAPPRSLPTTSWCALGASANTNKYLRTIDLDLVPAIDDDSVGLIVKDPGQIKYLSDADYCHPMNWYAMIETQRKKSQFRYTTYWGPNAVSSFGGCIGPYPKSSCQVMYNPAGFLPSSLGQLNNLITLRLRLLGIAAQPIPSWIGGMTALTCLDLSFNTFTGPLPSGLFLLTNLVRLHLNDNQLTGSLPTAIGLLTALQILEIGYHSYDQNAYEDYGAIPQYRSNSLSGSIPSEICLLTSLRRVQLNGNRRLSGTLPACMSSMTALRLVDVRFNSLSGALPKFAPPPVVAPRTDEGGKGANCPVPKGKDESQIYSTLDNYLGFSSILAYLDAYDPSSASAASEFREAKTALIENYFHFDSSYWCPWYLFFVLADNNNFGGPLPAYLAPSLGFAGLPNIYGSLRGGGQYIDPKYMQYDFP